MITLVSGSRDWTDREALEAALIDVQPDEIITGACEGADTIAIDIAKAWKIPFRKFPADWYPKHLGGRYWSGAGEARNIQMVNELEPGEDVIVACVLPQIRGTMQVIHLAEIRGHRLVRVYPRVAA
jgi:hypothetical protein